MPPPPFSRSIMTYLARPIGQSLKRRSWFMVTLHDVHDVPLHESSSLLLTLVPRPANDYPAGSPSPATGTTSAIFSDPHPLLCKLAAVRAMATEQEQC